MKKLSLLCWLLFSFFALKAQEAATASVVTYQNYDFRAGDKIIFADDFAADQEGEFPAHWDLESGQGVVKKLDGVPAFMLIDGNYVKVKPYMKTPSYLTDNFSVEFDIYPTRGAYGLKVFFVDAEDRGADVTLSAEDISWSSEKYFAGKLPESIAYDNYFDKWHHVAIAYKNDQLKAYIDEFRPLTVPHCEFKPANVTFGGIGSQSDPIIFKDVKIADGASMNMLDKIMTDGKFITHGIRFDVSSATIKPESMGVIGDVAKYMKDHPDLKLEVDGYTDSDGNDASNMQLSQARAESVKKTLIQSGIDGSRLTAKGFGETKPLGSNDTPEGKAMNRRVEFVKI
jgi:outer membrane protein OmpA-like peptidoglycan-associated protein